MVSLSQLGKVIPTAAAGAIIFCCAEQSAYGFFPPIIPADPPVTIVPPVVAPPVTPPVVVPPVPPPVVPPVVVPPVVPPVDPPLPPTDIIDPPVTPPVCPPPVTPQETPEPATLVSAAIGLAALAGTSIRKRRAAQA